MSSLFIFVLSLTLSANTRFVLFVQFVGLQLTPQRERDKFVLLVFIV